jgi:alpha,alpha-trehalase
VVDDLLYEVRHYGGVLNANRTYYLTRSQAAAAVPDGAARSPRDGDRAWLAGARDALVAVHDHWTRRRT